MKTIKDALAKAGVSVWRITRTHTDAAELYFIKKELDIPRYKSVTETEVEVFRDFEEDGARFRGSTTLYIDPGMTMDEMESKIRSAYFAASFVKNPWYDLPAKHESPEVASQADYRDMPLAEAAGRVADTLMAVESDDQAFINSAEIFVRRSHVSILDSAGTDVSYVSDSIWGEFVTQCISPVDVEQYRQFSYSSLDLAALKARLESGIRDVRLRAQAARAPKAGTYNVILTGENLREILNFYSSRSDSAMIYPHYSTWKVGDAVQKAEEGEKLNITLTSALPFSREGIALKDRPLITDGVLETIHGGARFASYLGIEPTGSYEKMVLKAGTMSYEEMKASGALEAVSFSDFQMDEMDGHFAGELRLALCRDAEGNTVPLTGGSINGDLLKTQGKLIFSTEQYADSTYEGPLAVLIPDVTVAGE